MLCDFMLWCTKSLVICMYVCIYVYIYLYIYISVYIYMWISLDLVIIYITFIPGYSDYLDQLSSTDNPLTTGSCTVLYWVGGNLTTGI